MYVTAAAVPGAIWQRPTGSRGPSADMTIYSLCRLSFSGPVLALERRGEGWGQRFFFHFFFKVPILQSLDCPGCLDCVLRLGEPSLHMIVEPLLQVGLQALELSLTANGGPKSTPRSGDYLRGSRLRKAFCPWGGGFSFERGGFEEKSLHN